jgi:hypothetical protein
MRQQNDEHVKQQRKPLRAASLHNRSFESVLPIQGSHKRSKSNAATGDALLDSQQARYALTM